MHVSFFCREFKRQLYKLTMTLISRLLVKTIKSLIGNGNNRRDSKAAIEDEQHDGMIY